MTIPENLRYTKEHEWVRVEDDGETATIGITEFAQGELGDIVFVEIEPVGSSFAADEVFGTVEAVKTVAELFMPIEGEIVAINEALEGAPELVNNDSFGEGWMIQIKMADPSSVEDLMDSQAYQEAVG